MTNAVQENTQGKYRNELNLLDKKTDAVDLAARSALRGGYSPSGGGSSPKGISGYIKYHLQSRLVQFGIASLLSFYLGATQGYKVEQAYLAAKKWMHIATSPGDAAMKEVVGRATDKSLEAVTSLATDEHGNAQSESKRYDSVVDELTKLDPSKLSNEQLKKLANYAKDGGLIEKVMNAK